MGEALANLAVHFRACESQNCVFAQSPSTVHEPCAWHTPLTEHAPERHTMPAFESVHGPCPSSYPHLPSLSSHALLRQRTAALSIVHPPLPF
jgi:hypothetical protein